MITKENARQIYNLYSQIEESNKIINVLKQCKDRYEKNNDGLDILTVVMKGGKRLYCDEVCPIDSLQEEPTSEGLDLEEEIQQHINDCLDIKFPTTDIKMIAKDVEYTARKFFELGLKTKGD